MIGVILANTGSPASPEPDDIELYLREFLMDDRIRQMLSDADPDSVATLLD